MYDLYGRLFDTLRTLSTEEMLLMNFSFISPKSCQYGTWGVLQSQFEEQPPYLDAPKYRALENAILLYTSCQSATAVAERVPKVPVIYPNPAGDIFWVKWEGIAAENLKISMFDLSGRLIKSVNGQQAISIQDAPPGLYLVKLWDEQDVINQLLIKN